MSDLWLNVRIGCYHIQIRFNSFRPKIAPNYHHKKYKYNDGYFGLYDLAWPFRK